MELAIPHADLESPQAGPCSAVADLPGGKKLRILHIVPTYIPAFRYGGPIRTVHGLTTALAQRGHEVHVYTTNVDGADDAPVPLDQAVAMDGVSIHYFRVPALRRLFWSPSMGARLRQSVAHFDVVHLHSIFLWPTWAAARSAQNAGVPYIISPHGMMVRELIHRKSRWVKTAWIQLFERQSLRRAAAIHVTAKMEAEEAVALKLPLPEVCEILHGIELPDRYAPLSVGPFAGVARPYALFLSRISWKKGLDRLLRAWKRVPDLHLVIAGNDDEDYLRKLKAIARSEGVADRVSFVGHASDDDKWALFENAEMFVLPSYNENFGCVVAEAMAMSCPVIITAAVGIAPLVVEAGAGIITTGEPEDLAQAVRALHADPARRKDMGARGRRAAEQHFSWSAVAAEMEQVYERIVLRTREAPT